MASYVYVKNPNGTTYVYENESYWDSKEKKTKHRRKCIGKLDPETKAVIPTYKARRQQKGKALSVTAIGHLLLLDKAAVEPGLSGALARAFPEDWSEILAAGYYVLTEKGPFSLIEPWSRSIGRPLDQWKLEEFLRGNSILALEQALIYNLRTGSDSSCCVFVVSGIPSLTHYLASPEEGSGGKRLTILAVTDPETLMPFTYKVLPEYPADLNTVIDHLSSFPRKHLVLGPGFYSDENIDFLLSTSTSFTMQVPVSSPLARKALRGERLEMNGRPCHAVLDRDESKARLESGYLERMLREGMEELRSGTSDDSKAAFYERFLTLSDGSHGYNEEEIRRYREEELGRVVLLSNKPMDPGKAKELSKRYYLLERNFQDIIPDYDQQVHGGFDSSLLPSRIFLDFVALMLGTYIQNSLDKKGWFLDEVFAELKGVKQITPENGKPMLTELSERQKEIIEYLDLLPDIKL